MSKKQDRSKDPPKFVIFQIEIDPPEGPKRIVPSFLAGPSLPEPQRTIFRRRVAEVTAQARELIEPPVSLDRDLEYILWARNQVFKMENQEQTPGLELPERWSAKAKVEVVLRLLRGEAIESVSREIQVPAHEVEAWRRVFLDGGVESLKRRGEDPEARAVKQAQAKVGELAMKLELAELLLEKRGFGDELMRLKRSRGL